MALLRAIAQPSAAASRGASRKIPPLNDTRRGMSIMPRSTISVSD